jgi:large-conductance mechanosensitive channel
MMLEKIRDTLNSVLKFRKGEGSQFFTDDGKQKLVETKIFFRKYTRLLAGLFIAAVGVAIAFFVLVQHLVTDLIMPLILGLVPEGAQTVTVNGQDIQWGAFVAHAVVFIIVFAAAFGTIRRLVGSTETPKEERTMRCPMCGEQILGLAIKCKHCGSTVGREHTHSYRSDYSAPRESYDRQRSGSERQRSGSDRQRSGSDRQRSGSDRQSRRPVGTGAGRSSSGGSDRQSSESGRGDTRSSSERSSHRRRSSVYRRRTGRYNSRRSSGRDSGQRDSNRRDGDQ